MQDIWVRLNSYRRSPLSAVARLIRRFPVGNLLPPGAGAFPASKLATSVLRDMQGVEIGGSAGNPFGLMTINVDVVDHLAANTAYAVEQRRVCGAVMPVDRLAAGNRLPFVDQEYDFVIASHVIEHFYDPISAIAEWVRVSRRFVYLIVPHSDRTFDRCRASTEVTELVARYAEEDQQEREDRHWSVWRTKDFVKLIEFLELPIFAVQDSDDKIGNGFTVVIGDLSNLDRTALNRRLAKLKSADGT